MGRRPDFLIIGAMKSATSSLYHQLRLQPGIFLPDLKEPNFFSDNQCFNKGTGWYESLFEAASETDCCGEASTHYSKLPTYPQTIARMQTVLPRPRLIYVMRDPVDRLISQYIHQWSEGEIRCSLDAAIERHPELIAYSRYAMQIEPYIEAFGRDAVLPVFFETLKSRPQGELERICRFIGHPALPEWHDEREPDNVSSSRIRRFPMSGLLINSRSSERLRRLIVPASVRRFVRQRLTMATRPVLSEEKLNVLDDIFTRDLRVLAHLLDRKTLFDQNGRASDLYRQIALASAGDQ